MESHVNKGTVAILRGAPGSGKSTYIKNHLANCLVCSADDFHYVNGVYCWKPQNVVLAHQQCYTKFLKALKENVKFVVVDNTNIKIKELERYYQSAIEYDYNVRIIRFSKDLSKIMGRNVHGVPNDTVTRMYQSIQDIPKHWDIKELIITQDL